MNTFLYIEEDGAVHTINLAEITRVTIINKLVIVVYKAEDGADKGKESFIVTDAVAYNLRRALKNLGVK